MVLSDSGSPYFMLFDIRLAESITYSAQLVNRWIHKWLHEKLKIDIYYSDTDSCDGDTIIISEKYGKIKIREYYNLINGFEEIKGENNKIKQIVEKDKVLSYSKRPKFNTSKYVMKHKVKKRMFKIKCNNDEVIITEDHSIIIERNNKIISIKPAQIIKGDKIIQISSSSSVSV